MSHRYSLLFAIGLSGRRGTREGILRNNSPCLFHWEIALWGIGPAMQQRTQRVINLPTSLAYHLLNGCNVVSVLRNMINLALIVSELGWMLLMAWHQHATGVQQRIHRVINLPTSFAYHLLNSCNIISVLRNMINLALITTDKHGCCWWHGTYLGHLQRARWHAINILSRILLTEGLLDYFTVSMHSPNGTHRLCSSLWARAFFVTHFDQTVE